MSERVYATRCFDEFSSIPSRTHFVVIKGLSDEEFKTGLMSYEEAGKIVDSFNAAMGGEKTKPSEQATARLKTFQDAVAKEIAEHHEAGRAVVVWRDGKVVSVEPATEESHGRRDGQAEDRTTQDLGGRREEARGSTVRGAVERADRGTGAADPGGRAPVEKAKLQAALSEAISRTASEETYKDLHDKFGYLLANPTRPRPEEPAEEMTQDEQMYCDPAFAEPRSGEDPVAAASMRMGLDEELAKLTDRSSEAKEVGDPLLAPYAKQSEEWRAGYDEAEMVYHHKQYGLRSKVRHAQGDCIAAVAALAPRYMSPEQTASFVASVRMAMRDGAVAPEPRPETPHLEVATGHMVRIIRAADALVRRLPPLDAEKAGVLDVWSALDNALRDERFERLSSSTGTGVAPTQVRCDACGHMLAEPCGPTAQGTPSNAALQVIDVLLSEWDHIESAVHVLEVARERIVEKTKLCTFHGHDESHCVGCCIEAQNAERASGEVLSDAGKAVLRTWLSEFADEVWVKEVEFEHFEDLLNRLGPRRVTALDPPSEWLKAHEELRAEYNKLRDAQERDIADEAAQPLQVIRSDTSTLAKRLKQLDIKDDMVRRCALAIDRAVERLDGILRCRLPEGSMMCDVHGYVSSGGRTDIGACRRCVFDSLRKHEAEANEKLLRTLCCDLANDSACYENGSISAGVVAVRLMGYANDISKQLKYDGPASLKQYNERMGKKL